MARKKSFSTLTHDMARASARAERERQQQQRTQQRELEKRKRESTRLEAQLLKDQKQRYLAERLAETEEANLDLQTRTQELLAVLESTLKLDDTISFTTLRSNELFRQFLSLIHISEPTRPY